ncbi:hypothetical protein FHG87_024320 [Trinorchestia longiramus]|nr:hypothetical protein FHG87_024320 [Trinorchestia longiramus]
MRKSKNKGVASPTKKQALQLQEDEQQSTIRKDRDIFSVQAQKRASKKKVASTATKNVPSLSDEEDEALKEIKQLTAQTKAQKNKFHNFVKQGLKICYEASIPSLFDHVRLPLLLL